MPMTPQKIKAMLDWCIKGVKAGWLLGPIHADEVDLNKVTLSPFGAVVQPNKIRPIVNLSYPKHGKNKSVNDTIKPEFKAVKYITLQEIVKLFYSLGKGAYVWSADAKDAYLMIPIRDNDMNLMGFRFGDYVFINATLMFGLSSACSIYTDVADGVEYCAINDKPSLFYIRDLPNSTLIQLLRHYLDDFFGIHFSKDGALKQMNSFVQTCSELNLPLKVEKLVFPTQIIRLLGWLHNIFQQKLYIPSEKFEKILSKCDEFIDAFHKKQSKTLLQWQSLYGVLRWAFTAIFAGESLLISMHYIMYKKHLPGFAQLRVTKTVCDDIQLCKSVIISMRNGLSYQWILNICDYNADIFVDACTTGLGGWTSTGQWFWYKFPQKIIKLVKINKPDIQYLEMLAIIIAASLFEHIYHSKNIRIWTDNEPVQHNIYRWKAPAHRIDKLHLLKTLSIILLKNDIKMRIYGIRTDKNVGADLLSRCNSNKSNDATTNIEKFKKFYVDKYKILPQNNATPCKKLFDQYWKLYQKSNSLQSHYNIHFKKYAHEFKLINNFLE